MRLLWLPLFAACLRASALPGWHAGWLAPLALVARIAWWDRAPTARRRVLGDWLGGTLFWLLAFSFLSRTAWAMPLGPAPILGLWWALEGAVDARLRHRLPRTWAAVLAVFLVEVLRGAWPMGGVPWASWGLGLADFPGALPAAAVVGENGLTLLALLAGAALVAWARRAPWKERLALPVALGLVAVAAAGLRRAPEPLEAVLALSIQPDIRVDEKSRDGGARSIFRAHTELAEEAVAVSGRQPELLVWAETMFLYPATEEGAEGELHLPRRGRDPGSYPVGMVLEWQRQGAAQAGLALPDHGWFVTGAHFYGPLPAGSPVQELSPRSSETLAFRPDGRLAARARKTELVPFGERLPFGGGFPGGRWVADRIYDGFGLHPSFVPGEGLLPLELERADGRPMSLGTAICWENVYERVFRRQAWSGAEAFLVLSNEAWFGTGAEMDQMVAATRLRAAETGRAVLRSTNTGRTVLVGGGGELLGEIPRGIPGAFWADLPRIRGDHRTPYLAAGWLLGPVLAVLAALGLLLPAGRRREDPAARA